MMDVTSITWYIDLHGYDFLKQDKDRKKAATKAELCSEDWIKFGHVGILIIANIIKMNPVNTKIFLES